MHAMATGWLIINISLYYHRMDTCHELGGCTLIKQPRITIGIAPPHIQVKNFHALCYL